MDIRTKERSPFQITAHPIFCRFNIYLFPVYHFRCMKFKPLVIRIWNQNIAISTIVGTSSHILSYFFLRSIHVTIFFCSFSEWFLVIQVMMTITLVMEIAAVIFLSTFLIKCCPGKDRVMSLFFLGGTGILAGML